MIEQILCKYVVPLAITVAACQPSEEALENIQTDAGIECSVMAPADNHCAGDALFCDDFDGPAIDERKWEIPSGIFEGQAHFQDSILNLSVENAGIILHSRPSYALDDRTYVLEARWKVGERGKTDFGIYLAENGGTKGVGFTTGPFGGELSSTENSELTTLNSINGETNTTYPADVSQFLVTTLILNKQRVTYCRDGEKISDEVEDVPNLNLIIDLVCQGHDQQERNCSVDYIRLNVNSYLQR